MAAEPAIPNLIETLIDGFCVLLTILACICIAMFFYDRSDLDED